MTAEPVLSLRDLHVDFSIGRSLFNAGRTLHAVSGVDLDIRRGEVLSIVGESGCGKSTLAKAILGIHKPTAGSITFEGTPMDKLDRRAISQRLQPIFQDPYSSLNPRMTVTSLIAMPLRVRGENATAVKAAREMMDLCGLPRRLENAYAGQLSGGQRQRVAIARALVTRPEILICDEPTSALDVSVQAQILNLLQDLQRERGLTYVFISHNLAVVRHFSTRVAVMYLGRIIEIGAALDVLDAPLHPYTQKLNAAALPPDPDFVLPPPVWEAEFPDPANPPPGCHFHPRCPQAMDVCRTKAPSLDPVRGRMVACHLYDVQ